MLRKQIEGQRTMELAEYRDQWQALVLAVN